MTYWIFQGQKLGKQNKKRLDNTTNTSLAPSTPSNSNEKMNENTDITSKKSLNEETHYSTTLCYIYDKLVYIIQTEPVYNPCTKHMLI